MIKFLFKIAKFFLSRNKTVKTLRNAAINKVIPEFDNIKDSLVETGSRIAYIQFETHSIELDLEKLKTKSDRLVSEINKLERSSDRLLTRLKNQEAI